jgi:hypothetical protein
MEKKMEKKYKERRWISAFGNFFGVKLDIYVLRSWGNLSSMKKVELNIEGNKQWGTKSETILQTFFGND